MQSRFLAFNLNTLARIAGAACITLLVMYATAAQTVEPRWALVIGNKNYRVSPLSNPINDARAVASALRDAGFNVDEKHDLDKGEMESAIDEFGTNLKKGGVGLFYFSGHGAQVDGVNYLIPIESRMATERSLRSDSVSLDLVLDQMEAAKNSMNIVVLDACRSNPLQRSTRADLRGLAYTDAPAGTIIAYATAPGKTASDGSGNNSPYTEELARYMRASGMSIEEVLKAVHTAVRTKTQNAQTPWYAAAHSGSFYFLPAANTTASNQPAPEVSTPPAEPRLWIDNTAQHSNDQSNPWNWSVFLCASDRSLFNSIAYVEYTLHPTFTNRVRNATDPTNNFALSTGGWGEFEILAKIVYKDGRIATGTHWLSLSEGRRPCAIP